MSSGCHVGVAGAGPGGLADPQIQIINHHGHPQPNAPTLSLQIEH